MTVEPFPSRVLPDLIKRMAPALMPERLVYARLPLGASVPAGLEPMAYVREREGTTLVLPEAQARSAGLEVGFPCRRIVLEVHSALDAVGFLATIAAWLGGHGIPCNVLSAWHHDHLLIPDNRAFEALDLLKALAREAG